MPNLEISVEYDIINVERLEKEVQKEIEDGLNELAIEIRNIWQQKASSKLNSTYDEYIRNLFVERQGTEVVATIYGALPVAIEQGSSRFDLKPGFLGSSVFRIVGIGLNKFRTVQSQSNKWWHPGIQAKAFHEQVQNEIPKMLGKIFSPIDRK